VIGITYLPGLLCERWTALQQSEHIYEISALRANVFRIPFAAWRPECLCLIILMWYHSKGTFTVHSHLDLLVGVLSNCNALTRYLEPNTAPDI
jgi:hypothetical protein